MSDDAVTVAALARERLIEAAARADYDYISGGDWEPWADAGLLIRQECEDRAKATVEALLADRDLLFEALGGEEMGSQEHFRGDEVVAYSFPSVGTRP